MKKTLSIALSLILALTLLGAAALAEAADFTGTWYTRVYGVEMSFSLNEGGLYTVSFDVVDEVEESEGTWEVTSTGIVFDKGTADETVMNYDAQADTLTGTIGGMELVFTRELPPPLNWLLPVLTPRRRTITVSGRPRCFALGNCRRRRRNRSLNCS